MKGKFETFGRKLFLLAGMQIVLVFLWLPPAAFCSSVTLGWDPSPDIDLAGYRVYYQADSQVQPFSGSGAVEGSAPIDAATSNSATINGLDPGNSYYFAVTAYNSAGVESVYSNVVEVQEMVPPTVGITSPSANSTVSGSVAVAASATDSKGVSRVEFYLNGALQGSSTAAPYGYNWDTSALGTGQYTLSAKAYDVAGNVGTSEVVVSVAGDSSPPAVLVTAPGNGATVSGNVTVAASAADNVGVAKMELYDNGTLIFAGNQGSLSYSWDTVAAANGAHVIAARAYDAAGNMGSATVSVSVVNDTTAPSVSIAAPLNNSTVDASATVTVNAGDNVAVSRVELYLNGVLLATGNAASLTYNWNTSTLANGNYLLSAKAYDAAGNAGVSGSVTVTVKHAVTDTTAPAVSITSPSSTGVGGSPTRVTASATDNIAVTRMEIYIDGNLMATTNAASISYSTKFSRGSHLIAVKAYDAAGNVGTASKTVTRN